MGEINTSGLIAGVITWVAMMWYATTQSACLKTNSCDGGDLFLFAVMGIGMLAPAWIVASIISAIFGSEE